jgi:hypothetical protein
VQVRLKVDVAVSAGVGALPTVGCAPLQAPLAVQLVALVDDQVSVDAPPLATVVGDAPIVTVGAGVTAVTVTVADWLPLPPVPVQVSV